MNSNQAVKSLYCAFRMCSTQEDGTHGPAERCARKGCRGGPFEREPMCETFRRDPTTAEPKNRPVIEFSEIRAGRERRRHEFVLKPPETFPERKLLKIARA